MVTTLGRFEIGYLLVLVTLLPVGISLIQGFNIPIVIKLLLSLVIFVGIVFEILRIANFEIGGGSKRK